MAAGWGPQLKRDPLDRSEDRYDPMLFFTRRPWWIPLQSFWSWLFAAKVIAWLHIAGGALGLIAASQASGLLLSLPFFGLSVIAGVLVLRRHREGVEASLLVEALQIVAVQVSGFVYQFASGVQLYLYVAGPQFGVNLSFRSALMFGPGRPGPVVAVDLFSFVAIPTLWRAMRERDRHDAMARAAAA